MYPHAVLEIYPMVQDLVGLNSNGVRCGLSENAVDPIRQDSPEFEPLSEHNYRVRNENETLCISEFE
jgi:hypothetical protein